MKYVVSRSVGCGVYHMFIDYMTNSIRIIYTLEYLGVYRETYIKTDIMLKNRVEITKFDYTFPETLIYSDNIRVALETYMFKTLEVLLHDI